MISVSGLSKSYGETRAVSEIGFEVREGEVMGFLGPNGAGKTTTLRMLSGFLPPSSGTALVAGRDITREGLEARRLIGYLPENNPLYEEMDAAEYLEWCASVRGLGGQERASRIRSAIESCALGEMMSRPIGLLSKGFRQRVGLAAAILHDPKVLLLDEPTSGLDPNQAREVRELILRLKTRKTVLFSTHILSEARSLCDRIMIIHKGRIAASGTQEELLRLGGGGSSLSLTLKTGSAGPTEGPVREALAGLAGIGSVELRTEGDELHVRVEAADAGDIRESVFRCCVDRRWTLLELKREEASLEKLFHELTQ